MGRARTFEDFYSSYLTAYPEASDQTVAKELWDRNNRLRNALERTVLNLNRAVAGKPVRDMTETLAEVDGALRDA